MLCCSTFWQIVLHMYRYQKQTTKQQQQSKNCNLLKPSLTPFYQVYFWIYVSYVKYIIIRPTCIGPLRTYYKSGEGNSQNFIFYFRRQKHKELTVRFSVVQLYCMWSIPYTTVVYVLLTPDSVKRKLYFRMLTYDASELGAGVG